MTLVTLLVCLGVCVCVCVAAGDDGVLVLFDQHAVDERIRLERFTQRKFTPSVSSPIVLVTTCYTRHCSAYCILYCKLISHSGV